MDVAEPKTDPDSSIRVHRPWPVILFFVAFLMFGQMLADDYGVSWDEMPQRLHGLVAFDYVNDVMGHPFGEEKRAPFELSSYAYRYHGLLFSTTCAVLENALKIQDLRDAYVLRHRCTALLFWVACVFFYALLARRFGDWRPALLGVVFLVASPRIFADSFYNPKDAVFASFYVIAGFTLVQLLRRPTAFRAVIHGLACSLALSSRVVGLFLPVLTLVLMATNFALRHPPGISRKHVARAAAVFAVSVLAFTYLCWPALWSNPLQSIREISHEISRFAWQLKVLYAGKFYAANALPWTYLPTWIGLTTPPLYLLLMVAGAGIIARRCANWVLRRGPPAGEDAVLLLLGAGPLLSAIVGSHLNYDGWRHLYFVYPFLLAVALIGLVAIHDALPPKCVGRIALAVLVAGSLLRTSAFMVREHPQQQVYFNDLAGHDVHLRYDADYWGVSYRQALERLLEIDKSPTVCVTAANFPGMANVDMLRKDDRARIKFVIDPAEADYYLTNFRGSKELAALAEKRPPFDREVFVLSTKRTAIVGAYRLARPAAAP